MVEQPFHFRAGKVGVCNQTSATQYGLVKTLCAKLIAKRGGSTILPDDGIVDGLSADLVPDHRCLALIGYANRGDFLRVAHDVARYLELRGPDLISIVLDPAGLRENLREFLLRTADDIAIVTEKNGAGGGGSLVQRENELAHWRLCPLPVLQHSGHYCSLILAIGLVAKVIGCASVHTRQETRPISLAFLPSGDTAGPPVYWCSCQWSTRILVNRLSPKPISAPAIVQAGSLSKVGKNDLRREIRKGVIMSHIFEKHQETCDYAESAPVANPAPVTILIVERGSKAFPPKRGSISHKLNDAASSTPKAITPKKCAVFCAGP